MRHEGGQVLASLIRATGDFDLAEDAVQDAVVEALESWPRRGVPDKPGAWLTTVARRRALDRIRREAARHAKEHKAAIHLLDEHPASTDDTASMVRDDMLRLIFTCCHPALAPESRVALTLRAVCGLATREIAAAFVVPEPTMAQRISRAKKKIAVAQIPYRVPDDHELPDRLPAVMAVLYVIFTAGHHTSEGPTPVRVDLAEEAIRLARLLTELLRDEPEADGLLALLLATHARAPARVDDSGDIVLLADQARDRWDRRAIEEAGALIDTALRRRRPGPYQVQAAIACLHGLARDWESTDWPQILELYDLLVAMQPSPIVQVNRAVAVSQVHGPASALAALEDLEEISNWHLYWSTKADLLRQLNRHGEAAAAYRRALACDANDADRRFISRRLDEVTSEAANAQSERPGR